MADNRRLKLRYAIIEAYGLAGYGNNVTFCLAGFDRNLTNGAIAAACPAAEAMLARLIVIAGLLAGASLAQAQPRETRGAAMGDFDFYVLSLSWSATWCQITGERRGARQCDSGRNPGFVVHGLWPQYERGYPAFCTPEGRNPSRRAMDIAENVLPDSGLAVINGASMAPAPACRRRAISAPPVTRAGRSAFPQRSRHRARSTVSLHWKSNAPSRRRIPACGPT